MTTLNQDFKFSADSAAANDILLEKTLMGMGLNTLAEYDKFFRLQGNSSNEGALNFVAGSMAAAGGKAGVKLAGLGQLIDKTTEARESADESKSSNMSQGARISEEQQAIEGLNYEVPEMAAIGHTKDDFEVGLASVYEQLRAAGIPESDLNFAMAAGGVDDPRATVEMFYDLALDNNIPVTGYIMDLDQGYAQLQIEDGMENIAPVVGLEIDAPTMDLDNRDLELEAKFDDFSPMRMS
ncbi:MAG: hypothetical protein COA45_04735 [Zetaproteobacteria bacterium]|nr:MAG: hypothetical protein COA45_04735 [Zetaproteobacteria bacterium]